MSVPQLSYDSITKLAEAYRDVAADTRIDRLVYELYGLTEEEIKVVEG